MHSSREELPVTTQISQRAAETLYGVVVDQSGRMLGLTEARREWDRK